MEIINDIKKQETNVLKGRQNETKSSKGDRKREGRRK